MARIPLGTLLIALPLGVVGTLAVLQLRAVNRQRDADEEHLEATTIDGAQGVTWDFNHELARAYDWFQTDTRSIAGDRWDAFADKIDAWLEQSHEPRLFAEWYIADGDELRRFDVETSRLSVVPWPSGLTSLRGVTSHVPELDEPPALIVPLLPHGLAIGLIDVDYLRDTIFPALVHDNLGDEHGMPYHVEIVRDSDPFQVVYATAAVPYPDVEVPLFRVGYAHLGELFLNPDEDGLDDGVWRLRIAYRGGGIAAHVERLRRRDLMLGAGVVGLLLASVGLLWIAARRSRRLAQQQLTFVAGITHELRTPLAVIRSAAENLADGLVVEPGKVQRYGQLLLGEGRRLSAMVEQAIDFAALEGGKRPGPAQDYDVGALVGELGGNDITTHIRGPLPALRGDPAATRLVLGNLLENARKHAPGSPIAIHVDAEERGVRIEVVDRGQGIAADDVPHVFEPFYRGQRARADQVPGSGLGLSMVKRLIEGQRGHIAVRSQPGQGASFIVFLPGAI